MSPCPLPCPLLVCAPSDADEDDEATPPSCNADDDSERLEIGMADAASEKSPLLAARGLLEWPAPPPRCVCCQDEGGGMEDEEA